MLSICTGIFNLRDRRKIEAGERAEGATGLECRNAMTWNLGTGNWNTVLWRAWDEILGSELTGMEWVVDVELWDGSEKTEGAGTRSRELLCDHTYEDCIMVPSLKSKRTLALPSTSVIGIPI